MLTARAAVVWRYLFGAGVKHALPIETGITGHAARALCGLEAFRPQDWYGTGSQVEYETLEGLRECRRCAARLGPVREVDRGGA